MVFIYLIPILALYALFDVHYFIRSIWIIYMGRWFQKSLKILDNCTTYGMCTTQDVDINGYMNKARYQRELDFARYLYSDRTGLYSEIMKRGLTVVGATVVHYFHNIPIFIPFKLVTEMVHWDEKAVYVRQKCITLHDNLVRVSSFTKHAIIGVDVREVIAEIDPTARLPDLPEDLELWIQSLEETSKKYRKKD